MNKQLEVIHQAAAGERQPSPLLFIHGAYSNASCWQQHFMPWFAQQGFDCRALSLEGHGNSEGQDYLSAISIDDYVANLRQTITDYYPEQQPVVIAHSMGGYVVQDYLTRYTLPGVALLASVPPSGLSGSSMRLMTHSPDLLTQLNRFQQGHYQPDLDGLRHLLFSDDADLAAVDWVAHHSQTESERAIMDMHMPSLFSRALRQPLPALVLGAADDQLISADDNHATAQRLGCHAHILPAIGHMMMLDNRWEQCAISIRQWLSQTGLAHDIHHHTASPCEAAQA